jgi:hypothetical protein
MGIALYDSLDDIIEVINDNWSLGYMPILTKSYEQKAVGFVDARRDIILIYPKKENIQYWGLFGTDHLSEVDLNIEVRTFQNHDHHNNIVKEVAKIVKDNIRRTNFVDLRIMTSISENDVYRNMYKHVLGVRYRKLNPA